MRYFVPVCDIFPYNLQQLLQAVIYTYSRHVLLKLSAKRIVDPKGYETKLLEAFSYIKIGASLMAIKGNHPLLCFIEYNLQQQPTAIA